MVQKLLVGADLGGGLGTGVPERLMFHDPAPYKVYTVPGLGITAFLLF